MEIRSQSFTLQPLESVGPAKNAGGSGHRSAPGQPPPEDVASLNLGQALSGDDTRVGRVQAVQQQIANGSYQISAQAVASKLLSNMAEGA